MLGVACPKVLVTRNPGNGGSIGKDWTPVGPWPSETRGSVDGDLAAGREAEVGAIRRATDDGWVVAVDARSRTSFGQCIGKDGA